jgi:hypothetical protein
VSHQNYIDNGLTYTVAPDVRPPLGQRMWALVQAEILDELTGQPPLAALDIESPNLGVFPRVAEDGIVGLAGIPRDAFSELATQNYTVNLTITAARYIAIKMAVVVASIPTFPALFNTTDLGVVALHRAPMLIKGRVVVSSGVTSTPVPGAKITLTGIWRTVPPAHIAVPPSPPDLVSLQPGLYFARAAAATQITQQALVPVVGANKQLLVDAGQGATMMRLSDCIGLVINDVLAVDGDDPFRTEYMTIQNIFPASTPNQPATIQLTYGLQATHRQNAPVRKVTLAAPGAATPLSADAIAGDICAFVGSAATLRPATTVKITDLANPTEYQAVSYFDTITDAQGFYRLPPLSRVAQLNLKADIGVLPPPKTVTFVPDYSQEEDRVDFVF